MTDTKELRRLALLATPGPRATYNENEGMGQQYMPLWSVANEEYHNPTNADAPCFDATVYSGCKEDADLIAALSPSVVLALLDRLEAAEKVMAEQTDALAMFMSATVSRSPLIDPRGYQWDEDALEEARNHVLNGFASPQPEKEERAAS